ncbi:hypothetical protein QC762_406010 [Podospora pseudocomata]|uniref:Calcineurin-like phosphoesterase domain-containing protein n=1 Tax=Podospora pseudocomata TaxID=2093779 RepID=A0ABR0GGS2_9PEZI|nr:hypothetical protein QC762_406010 [Podospora pseudocomata]
MTSFSTAPRPSHASTALGVPSTWGGGSLLQPREVFQPPQLSSSSPININMAKFQILSDLHLEVSPAEQFAEHGYSAFHVEPRAPYLALLGDIGLITQRDALRKFLLIQLGKFKVVFFVAGNHEPYSSSWEEVSLFLEEMSVLVEQRRKEGEELGDFVPLGRTRYDIKGEEGEVVTVLGCTLHSYVASKYKDEVTRKLNDFYRIKGWTVKDHNKAHEADKDWLNKEVKKIEKEDAKEGKKRKVVIFTHHSPTTDRRANDAQHERVKGWEAVASAFRTDLSREKCWRSDRVKLWAFGHTHFNCDFSVDGKRVCTNQKGYGFVAGKGMSPGFDPERVVEV